MIDYQKLIDDQLLTGIIPPSKPSSIPKPAVVVTMTAYWYCLMFPVPLYTGGTTITGLGESGLVLMEGNMEVSPCMYWELETDTGGLGAVVGLLIGERY